MAMQSLDIKRRSATTTPPPGVRERPSARSPSDRLHRLQGLPGRVHGMERRPRDEVGGTNVGVYDNRRT